mmetsp:Transcript_75829/g.218978  ORF Transcript_75829/g.218978 Transcript_75829/m.218978 type:complete len:246 (+) Transcript_75829:436-1173(+)
MQPRLRNGLGGARRHALPWRRRRGCRRGLHRGHPPRPPVLPGLHLPEHGELAARKVLRGGHGQQQGPHRGRLAAGLLDRSSGGADPAGPAAERAQRLRAGHADLGRPRRRRRRGGRRPDRPRPRGGGVGGEESASADAGAAGRSAVPPGRCARGVRRVQRRAGARRHPGGRRGDLGLLQAAAAGLYRRDRVLHRGDQVVAERQRGAVGRRGGRRPLAAAARDPREGLGRARPGAPRVVRLRRRQG